MAAEGTISVNFSKRGNILAHLRRKIVCGEMLPGSQLPKRTEIEEQFGVSSVTVQRALDRLTEDGFVHARRGQGTFVAENPPHKSHFALVFQFKPGDVAWSRFYNSIHLESQRIAKEFEGSVRFSVAFGVDGHTDTPDYQRLISDIREERLAGLIFAYPPHALVQSGDPLVTTPGLVRVCISPGNSTLFSTFRTVYPDVDGWIDRALDLILAQGRKRIALLSTAAERPSPQFTVNRFIQRLRAAGLPTPSIWRQHVAQITTWTAAGVVELLLSGRPEDRPDALVIADDNLVESATAGIQAAGVQTPDDLLVVAHCNYPHPPNHLVPVTFLGFDIAELLRRCVEQARSGIEHIQSGGPMSVPPVFEYEQSLRNGSLPSI